MKHLKDYSEDIYKCTKCGLCQSVCPIFEETGLETAVSRGKFTLLNGILNGHLNLTKNTAKYLDLCLGCQACYDFCPSGIKAEDIIIAARQLNFKANGLSALKKLLISNFDSKFRLNALKILLNIYRKTALPIIDKLLFSTSTSNLCSCLSVIQKSLQLFNAQVKENINYKKLAPVKPVSSLKIVYFPGCIGTYVNSSVKNSVLMVLEKNGIKVNIPEGLSCCGIPARSAGDIDTFIKMAKNNLDKISGDIDYLITDCASCGAVWQHYSEVLEDEYKEKAEILSQKALNINKFLTLTDLFIPENSKINKSVTYHDPCHLKRSQGIYNEPREILQKIPGIKYIEMNQADKCCGASGNFCIIKPEISRAISRKKAENILNTGADIVSTSCPSCQIGLNQGLIQFNSRLPVYQPVELLAELYLQNS